MEAKKHRLPATFRSLRTLRALNVVALASALAAGTGSVFGHLLGESRTTMATTATSTFLVALVWASILRSKSRFLGTRLRSGWAWSVPLAALNGALSLGLLTLGDRGGRFLEGFVLGGTFGAILWIPGLLVVLALYGYPIARAQALAEKGLSGEERGERFVAVVSALIAPIALAILPRDEKVLEPLGSLGDIGPLLVVAFALAAFLSGVAAAVLATYRERVRRAFVREVEQGTVEGFRLEESPAGRVLVRVTSQGGGYRAASFEEQVYGLDEGGEARGPLTSEA